MTRYRCDVCAGVYDDDGGRYLHSCPINQAAPAPPRPTSWFRRFFSRSPVNTDPPVPRRRRRNENIDLDEAGRTKLT